jgi:hypothetical protein
MAPGRFSTILTVVGLLANLEDLEMKLMGANEISVPREVVWQAFNDAAAFQACVSVVEECINVDDNVFPTLFRLRLGGYVLNSKAGSIY